MNIALTLFLLLVGCSVACLVVHFVFDFICCAIRARKERNEELEWKTLEDLNYNGEQLDAEFINKWGRL